MNWRSFTAAVLMALALSAVAEVLATTQPSSARADVCASVGRRVSVSGCTNLGQYVPPPSYYAPLPEDYPPPPPPP
jgi:hypothetical protein